MKIPEELDFIGGQGHLTKAEARSLAKYFKAKRKVKQAIPPAKTKDFSNSKV